MTTTATTTTASDTGRAVTTVRRYLTEHPETARSADSAATAVVTGVLRCQVDGPGGATVHTDLPAVVGGGATAPTPGWSARAGHASCEATLTTLRAAELGVTLDRVEVAVNSESDDRGMLAFDDTVPAGPLSSRTRVGVTDDGVDRAVLRDLVARAHPHAPVTDPVRGALPVTVEVELTDGVRS